MKRKVAPKLDQIVHAFDSLGTGAPQEVMIHVYWSARGDERDAREGGHAHRMQRDKVTADLGLDRVPDPGFTSEEMQQICFAAKIAALTVIRRRKRAAR